MFNLTVVKKRRGRQELRKFVSDVKSAYKSALLLYKNDSESLKYTIYQRWRSQMSMLFHYTEKTEEKVKSRRQKLLDNLPRPLKFRKSAFPNDPFVDDPDFFESLFQLRVSWRTFSSFSSSTLKDEAAGESLRLVYEKFKELWLEIPVVWGQVLLSEALFMWDEMLLERIVSTVTEWEICGIVSYENDIWTNGEEIPSDVIPPEVQNSLINDDLYEFRIFHHDLLPKPKLFYGLPVGMRLPTCVPEIKVADYDQARRELLEAAQKIGEDQFHGITGLQTLGNVANQFLRAAASLKARTDSL